MKMNLPKTNETTFGSTYISENCDKFDNTIVGIKFSIGIWIVSLSYIIIGDIEYSLKYVLFVILMLLPVFILLIIFLYGILLDIMGCVEE